MNGRFVYLKKSLAIAGFLLLSSVANAQVMWNLKGGVMQRASYYEPYYLSSYDLYIIEEAGKHIDWTAGLEIEIPLSQRFNLETGLRYKNHCSLNKFEDIDFTENTTFEKLEFSKDHIELPLRFTYKQPLGKYFSLHVGIGPYASYTFFDSSNSFSHNLRIGLEPSIAINWACLSLGATYNVPCLHKGFKDENKPVIMATLGIRFKSSAWKYVGATLLTIATVGGAAASAWSSAVEANQNYSSSSYGSYGSSSSRNSSSSTTGNKYSITGQQNANNAQTAYNRYGVLLSKHFYGSTSATLSEVKQWQNEMKKLKQKWGDKIVYNDLQDKSTSNCINSSHSH